jgi:hypothetical protein
MRSIQDILENNGVDMTDWTLTRASGVSADGTAIVGYGTNPDGNTEAWLVTGYTPVPEPSALALGGILLFRRRPFEPDLATRIPPSRWKCSPYRSAPRPSRCSHEKDRPDKKSVFFCFLLAVGAWGK